MKLKKSKCVNGGNPPTELHSTVSASLQMHSFFPHFKYSICYTKHRTDRPLFPIHLGSKLLLSIDKFLCYFTVTETTCKSTVDKLPNHQSGKILVLFLHLTKSADIWSRSLWPAQCAPTPKTLKTAKTTGKCVLFMVEWDNICHLWSSRHSIIKQVHC